MRFISLEPTLALATLVLATAFVPAAPAIAQHILPKEVYAAPDDRRSEEQSYVTTGVVVDRHRAPAPRSSGGFGAAIS